MKRQTFLLVRSISFLWLMGLIFSACEIINPEEDTPAYLYVQPFTLTTNPQTQGSSSHRITEAWLFVNGEYLGAYNLPALIPVLAEGNATVRLEAGIKENGLSATPDINPFYEPFRLNMDLAAGRIDTIRPQTRYVDQARFAFIEDFENERSRIFTRTIIATDIAPNGLPRTSAPGEVFEGQFSGLLKLNKENPIAEISTNLTFEGLLDRGAFVYLEVNYKAEAPVIFGIVSDQGANYNRYYDPGFLARDNWNKIYFNLGPVIFNSNEDNYRISFQALLPTTTDSARIWMDNIKLVHF